MTKKTKNKAAKDTAEINVLLTKTVSAKTIRREIHTQGTYDQNKIQIAVISNDITHNTKNWLIKVIMLRL